ncbi:MAG: hypothetical protein K0U68_02020 [Gammaproteobacteria bacterium]|nr:hypothetical protein [Gammaproteobacteria bacterium]
MAATNSENNNGNGKILLNLIILAIGIAIGFLFNVLFYDNEDNGARIRKVSEQNKSTLAPLIGDTHKLVTVLPGTGKKVKDCSEKQCRSELKFDENNLPQLVNRETKEPIKSGSVELLYHASFKGSYCESYWINGTYVEYCCEDDDPFC